MQTMFVNPDLDQYLWKWGIRITGATCINHRLLGHIPGPRNHNLLPFFFYTSPLGNLRTYKHLRTTVPRPSFFLVPIKVVIHIIKDRISISGKARQVIQTKKGKLAACRSSPSLSRCQNFDP